MGGVIFQRFLLYMRSIQLRKNFTFLINTDHVHIMTDCMQIILLIFLDLFCLIWKKISDFIFVGYFITIDGLYNHLREKKITLSNWIS